MPIDNLWPFVNLVRLQLDNNIIEKIEGLDVLSARDVYTGRVIWKAPLEDLGTFGVYYDKSYTTNQSHIPGANARGTNFVATLDKVYIIHGKSCLVLDSETGNHVNTIDLPVLKGGDAPEWGYIGVYRDALLCAFLDGKNLA